MKIYDGVVKLIGAGTWIAERNNDGGQKLSVLEIGDYRLTGIYLPDYLYNYLRQGSEATVLVCRSTIRTSIFAIKVDGKKYKIAIEKIIFEFILKILLFSAASITIGYFIPDITGSYFFLKPFSYFLSALYAASKVKAVIDFIRF